MRLYLLAPSSISEGRAEISEQLEAAYVPVVPTAVGAEGLSRISSRLTA